MHRPRPGGGSTCVWRLPGGSALKPACLGSGLRGLGQVRAPGQGCPATVSRPAKQKHRRLLQRRGHRGVYSDGAGCGPWRTPWPRAASAAQAVVKPTAGPCGVGLPQEGGAAGLAATQHLPAFPRPVTRSCLPSPRVLGPSAPSSSPGLIGRTLTLAADGAQSSSTPGRKRHTNRADRCISNSERSTKGARWLPRFVTGRSPSRLGPSLTSTATVWPPPGSWAGHTATGHHGARAVFHF